MNPGKQGYKHHPLKQCTIIISLLNGSLPLSRYSVNSLVLQAPHFKLLPFHLPTGTLYFPSPQWCAAKGLTTASLQNKALISNICQSVSVVSVLPPRPISGCAMASLNVELGRDGHNQLAGIARDSGPPHTPPVSNAHHDSTHQGQSLGLHITHPLDH